MTWRREVRNRTKVYSFANAFGTTAANWVHATDGVGLFLPSNKTGTTAILDLSGLEIGEKIVGFRILGSIGAGVAFTTILNANLRKVTKGAGSLTDSSVASITQVSSLADVAVDSEAVIAAGEFVLDDYAYYIRVVGTTGNTSFCDISLSSVELDLQ